MNNFFNKSNTKTYINHQAIIFLSVIVVSIIRISLILFDNLGTIMQQNNHVMQ